MHSPIHTSTIFILISTKQCRNMHWENIQYLIEDIREDLLRQGHLFVDDIDAENIDLAVKSRQQGVVRTNCIDCLDRTNVLQSALALSMADLPTQTDGPTCSDGHHRSTPECSSSL